MAAAMTAEVLPFERKTEVAFKAQPGPQTALLSCPVDEIFFGGARGGGKTFVLAIDWSAHSGRYGSDSQGVIFRKTYKELEEVVKAFKTVCYPLGGRVVGQDLRMPNGAVLKFRHLKREADADDYQGHQYTWIAFDEITNWSSPDGINKLRACLRSAVVPPHGLRFLCTGNPGGVGHNWVKARYIDVARPYEIVEEHDEDTNITKTRVFIPSLLSDNPALAENDPGYVARLKDAGPAWLVKAWIEGDWSIIAGGMFDDVIDTKTPHGEGELVWGYGNKCAPFRIPHSWRVDRAFDWGSSAPFSVGWYAMSDGTEATAKNGCRIVVPRGTVFRIAEWYGWSGKPNSGCRMLAKDVAAGILEREKYIKEALLSGQAIKPGPADTAIWAAEDGVSIADKMKSVGVKWTEADKRPGSRVNGWELCREWLEAGSKAIIDRPAFICFDTCLQWWRVVPVTPRDDRNMDDVDTNSEDHIQDEWRYRLQNVVREVKVRKLSGL